MKIRTWLSQLWNSYLWRRSIRVKVRDDLADERGAEELEQVRKGIRRMPPGSF
jgi:hypothetical protein